MKTVLLIDDEPEFRTLLGEYFKSHQWEVVEAADGESGVNLALKHRPEAVVCDLLMPGFTGFQVCRAIRKHRELNHTGIVVVTGRGYPTDRQNAMEDGAQEYVVKPVSPVELLRIIEQFTRQSGDRKEEPVSTAPAQPTRVKFWGVRGSIPTPGPSTVHYGGNTSCVEVRGDGEIIVLDSGSGIRPLGLSLLSEFKDRPIDLTLLITHTHWDHIQGFPFFTPAYNPKNHLRILGYEGAKHGLETALAGQMESPYFPVSLRQMPGHINIQELHDLEFSIGNVEGHAFFVNHPGICVGYHLQTSNGSVAYVPDNEPFQRLARYKTANNPEVDQAEAIEYARAQDQRLIDFIRGADILMMDSQYDSGDYPKHVGWGHSCVDDSVDFAIQAGVKQFFLFHHDPNHDDAKITSMVASARKIVAARHSKISVEAAREGSEVVLKSAALRS